jgi:hypothetical protein
MIWIRCSIVITGIIPHRSRGNAPEMSCTEKARLEVERQRKAIAWEEERQRKVIAFEGDPHRWRLVQLANRRLPQTRTIKVRSSPEISSFSSVPTVPQKEVAAIFEGKFDPKNLYKLHRKVVLTNEDEDEITIKKRGKYLQTWWMSTYVEL